MRKHAWILDLAALCLGTALLLPAPAAAYWPTTVEQNLPIAVTPVIDTNPTAVPSPNGNTLVAFQHSELGTCYQLVDRFGNLLFAETQLAAPAIADAYNFLPRAVADEAGGAYVVWIRQYTSTGEAIYAQHLDSLGNRLWGDSGVRIYPVSDLQWDICADSQGGFWMAITPSSSMCGTGDYLYVQRVDAAGNLAFGDSGLVARYIPQGIRYPLIVPDEDMGCFVVWEDHQSGMYNDDIRAQHFDENGNALWAQDLYICQNTNSDVRQIIPDGQGGLLLQADPGYVNYNTVWRISSQGQILWSRDHVSWWSSEIVLGEPGFFYLGFYYTGGSVYAQRMDLNGNTYWPTWPSGVGALMYSRTGWYWSGDHFHYRYANFYGVFDLSNNPGYTNLLVVQKLDSLGNRILGDYGATLSGEQTQYGEFVQINSFTDYEEGIIAVFHTGSGLGQDIYAKRCNADGSLGGPFPLEVTLTPHALPIIIPSTGGSFTYDVAIVDTTLVAGLVDIWVEVTFPDGASLTLLARNDLSFQPGDTLSRVNIQQFVPASAPSGVYTYAVKAGNYPYASPWGQDSFTFVKQGGEAYQGTYPVVNSPGGGLEPSTAWALQGWEESDVGASAAADSAPSIPGQLRLLVGPNPFNLETAISFTLPTAGETQLFIYDVRGREIGHLQNGTLSAGAYTISWNADQQSSGIYLVRLQTESGEVTQKILFLK